MEREILLLGLLRLEAMHGYQINEFIDAHLGSGIQLKKATAYHLLKRMAADGWITASEEQDGNRPPRRVYAITPAGEATFQRLLRDSLATYSPAEFPGDMSFAFLDALPPAEGAALLRQRRAAIATALDAVPEYEPEHTSSMLWMLEHQRRHLAAELAWTDEIIARLEQLS